MNKKSLFISTLITASLAVVAGTFVLNNQQRASELRANPSLTEHTITLTADDVYLSGDQDTGYYSLTFYKENATLHGDTYEYNESGNTIFAKGGANNGGCIFDAIYGIDEYDEEMLVYFDLQLPFSNIAETVSVTLHGDFYTDSSFSNPMHSITYGNSRFYVDSNGNASFSAHEEDYYRVVLNSIEITYRCA